MTKSIKNTERSLEIAKLNEKAFIKENSLLKEENLMFKFTIEQLNYFQDSLNTKLNQVRKELNIKDEDVEQLQYLLSQAQKVDTIIYKDTLFIDPTLKIDTLIGDKWYQCNIGLEYPNKVIVKPDFISEKYIIVSSRKETIDPPKKCFILRWFQKKHKVVEVNVIEKNPYIKNKQQRFIEIIE
jgi:hypothetical protein